MVSRSVQMLPYVIKGLVVVIKGRDLEMGEIILDSLNPT